MTANDEEAWNYFSLKAIDRIAELFGVGAELLQFKPNQDAGRTCKRQCRPHFLLHDESDQGRKPWGTFRSVETQHRPRAGCR